MNTSKYRVIIITGVRCFFVTFFLLSGTSLFAQQKLTVNDVVMLSKEKNPLVNVYRLNADIQKQDITTAGLRPNLLFNQQSLFLLSQQDLNKINPGQNMFISPYASQLWFQLTKQYQIANKRKAKIEFQIKDYEFSEKDVAQFANDIAYQTALKWLDVWYAKVGLDIIIKAEQNIDTLLVIDKLRLKNQVITANEVTRTQIISDKYATMLNVAKQKYRSELKKLAFLVGSADSVTIDDEYNFFYKNISTVKDSLVNTAYNQRPDIQSNIASLEIARSNIKLQKALAYPNLEFGVVMNPQNTQPYAGWYFQMPIPVFDRNQGERQKSYIQQTQATRQIETAKAQANTEVTYTMEEYEINRENSERYREIIEASNHVLRNIKVTYLRGGTTIVDYLLAQQNWFETQKSYYEAVYLYRKSYIDLLYVTGTLSSNN